MFREKTDSVSDVAQMVQLLVKIKHNMFWKAIVGWPQLESTWAWWKKALRSCFGQGAFTNFRVF